MKKKIKKNPNYVNNLTLTLVNNDTKEVLEKKYLFIKNKDLFRLQSRINNIWYDTIMISVHICYDSKKDLYRAYYHGKAIFRSKNIETLKKRIRKWDKDFKEFYKENIGRI